MNLFAITRHRQRIEQVFERADQLPYDADVLRSDLARYLCVLVAGFVERSLQTIYVEYAKASGPPRLALHIERQSRRGTNYNMDRILTLVSSFGDDWTTEIKAHPDFDRFKSAADSIVAIRNRIAHGEDVGISYVDVRDYFATIVELLDLLVSQCDR